MYVEKCINNGIAYLRLVEGVYSKTKDGKPTCKKRLIYSIGPLSKFDDGKPDYVQRLKDSFKNGSPLIEALKPYCEKVASIIAMLSKADTTLAIFFLFFWFVINFLLY